MRCARFDNGRYLAPELLTAPIRVGYSAEDKFRAGEIGPVISPDGKYLFFQSNRSDSGVARGLYWIGARVIEALRPAASR